MRIITLGNELLRQKAESVKNFNEELKTTIEKMFEALKAEKGVGLAGPQVGFMKRVFITNIDKDEPRVFINPTIIETSEDTAKAEEGCLSIPGVYADVVRSETVKVQAWNEKKKPFTLETGGLLARVIQHESDHLDGILFFDRLPEDKKEKFLQKYEKKQSKEQKQK